MQFKDSSQDCSAKLVAIGGGDFPLSVSEEILRLAHGVNSRVVVCPLASEDPETGDIIANKRFRNPFGLTDVSVFDFCTPESLSGVSGTKANLVPKMREFANSEASLGILNNTDVFYFSGGDQRLILNTLTGTLFHKRLMDLWRQGKIVIAGTSAGLQVQSELAFTGDFHLPESADAAQSDDWPCPTIARGIVELVPGLGFMQGIILDQHFVARRRQNRLISAVLENPTFLGVGIDEGTAIVLCGKSGTAVRPSVIGKSCAFFVDATDAQIHASKEGLLRHAYPLKCGVVWAGGDFPFEIRLG